MLSLIDPKIYYNKKPLEFVLREKFDLKEDRDFVPRFSLKDVDEIKNIPINRPLKYSDDMVVKAIKFGMIFLIHYKGEGDTFFAGRERVIYPLVLGKSSKGKKLLRGYHLKGYSFSQRSNVQKIWRMFRTDRILSMTFTGSFYRLPPDGYNMADRGMRGGIIAAADFSQIRKNQTQMVKDQVIQNREDITLSGKEGGAEKFVTVTVKATDTMLDLTKPLENAYMNNIKNITGIRVSFLKSIYGTKYIAILGALGQPGNTVKVLVGGSTLGVFKVLDSIDGNTLKRIKGVKGNSIYDLYLFEKKV
jgi:hypothetical protein